MSKSVSCEACLSPKEILGEKEKEKSPLTVKECYLLIYPDLIPLGKTFQVKWEGLTLWVAKPDIGVLSVTKGLEVEEDERRDKVRDS